MPASPRSKKHITNWLRPTTPTKAQIQTQRISFHKLEGNCVQMQCLRNTFRWEEKSNVWSNRQHRRRSICRFWPWRYVFRNGKHQHVRYLWWSVWFWCPTCPKRKHAWESYRSSWSWLEVSNSWNKKGTNSITFRLFITIRKEPAPLVMVVNRNQELNLKNVQLVRVLGLWVLDKAQWLWKCLAKPVMVKGRKLFIHVPHAKQLVSKPNKPNKKSLSPRVLRIILF